MTGLTLTGIEYLGIGYGLLLRARCFGVRESVLGAFLAIISQLALEHFLKFLFALVQIFADLIFIDVDIDSMMSWRSWTVLNAVPTAVPTDTSNKEHDGGEQCE